MFLTAEEARQWYQHLRALRLCVQCLQPVDTPHARCAVCRKAGAQAQARYRVRKIMQETRAC